jgi:hypothetical protein
MVNFVWFQVVACQVNIENVWYTNTKMFSIYYGKFWISLKWIQCILNS